MLKRAIADILDVYLKTQIAMAALSVILLALPVSVGWMGGILLAAQTAVGIFAMTATGEVPKKVAKRWPMDSEFGSCSTTEEEEDDAIR